MVKRRVQLSTILFVIAALLFFSIFFSYVQMHMASFVKTEVSVGDVSTSVTIGEIAETNATLLYLITIFLIAAVILKYIESKSTKVKGGG